LKTYLHHLRFEQFVFVIITGTTCLFAHASQENPWFTITPYVGVRHIGLGTTSNATGNSGNIGTKLENSLFFAVGLETFEYSFNDTPWGFTLYGYAANVDLSEQWSANGTTNSNGTAGGSRINVGTRVSGYYSYLVPTLHYNLQDKKGNGLKAALGYGEWNANFSGTIILTPNDSPVSGMLKTPVSLNETKLGYLFLMQFQFQNGWTGYMSVGGPRWESKGITYQLEEVAIAVGHPFSF